MSSIGSAVSCRACYRHLNIHRRDSLAHSVILFSFFVTSAVPVSLCPFQVTATQSKTSLLRSKLLRIHCQCLHQQEEMIADIRKDFMGIIWTHSECKNKKVLNKPYGYILFFSGIVDFNTEPLIFFLANQARPKYHFGRNQSKQMSFLLYCTGR